MTRLKQALIADDHSATRRGLAEFVRELYPDVAIGEAHDAHSTLAKVREGGWGIVLLDALMPGGQGVEVARSIRTIDPDLPILVITAATELEFVIQSMKAGANGFIHKHRAGDEIIEAIGKVATGETYLHPDTAIEIAHAMNAHRPGAPHDLLSEREFEIFRLLAQGRAVKEIAGDLGISAKTVATYVSRIRQKTGLGSYVEITRYALQNGLVD